MAEFYPDAATRWEKLSITQLGSGRAHHIYFSLNGSVAAIATCAL